MASSSTKPRAGRDDPALKTSRRIIVVVVPPVDELDLVGALQVFNSVNRLAERPIYTIEVVTNANHLTVEGEGGVMTFVARDHFSRVAGALAPWRSSTWMLTAFAGLAFVLPTLGLLSVVGLDVAHGVTNSPFGSRWVPDGKTCCGTCCRWRSAVPLQAWRPAS